MLKKNPWLGETRKHNGLGATACSQVLYLALSTNPSTKQIRNEPRPTCFESRALWRVPLNELKLHFIIMCFVCCTRVRHHLPPTTLRTLWHVLSQSQPSLQLLPYAFVSEENMWSPKRQLVVCKLCGSASGAQIQFKFLFALVSWWLSDVHTALHTHTLWTTMYVRMYVASWATLAP